MSTSEENSHYLIIKKLVIFQYSQVGYVDVEFVQKMSGIPVIVIRNVLEQEGFQESGIKNQFIKKGRR